MFDGTVHYLSYWGFRHTKFNKDEWNGLKDNAFELPLSRAEEAKQIFEHRYPLDRIFIKNISG